MKTLPKKLLVLGLVGVITLMMAELALRIQQALGPLYDLEMRDTSLAAISPVLNHKPTSGTSTVTLVPKSIYGQYNGTRYEVRYDENGVKLSSLRPSEGPGLKILFLGDSFMEGFDDRNTIPQHVYDALRTADPSQQLVCLNAGCSSYSPALFIPQARGLLARLKPDYVVIDIDETDIGDDWFRYRHLMERDAAGHIVTVRPTPTNVEFLGGLMRVRDHSLYVVRLAAKIHHTYFHMPAFQEKYKREMGIEHSLSITWTDEATAWQKYRDQIAFFERNLQDFSEELMGLMGGADRILFCRHPYLWHFKTDPNGRSWNRVSAAVIAQVARRNGIRFYDAEPDLKAAFGARPDDFYWPNDIHFNFEGLRTYGQGVAREVRELIKAEGKRTVSAVQPQPSAQNYQ